MIAQQHLRDALSQKRCDEVLSLWQRLDVNNNGSLTHEEYLITCEEKVAF